MSLRIWTCLAVLTLALAGCIDDVSVPTTRFVPGNIVLAGARTLGVAGIGGKEGDVLGDLVDQQIHHNGLYRVVDRRYVAQLLDERELTQPFGDPADAGGAWAGADVLLVGHVTMNIFDQDFSWNAQPHPAYPDYTVYHRTGVATVRATFKFISASTGEMLALRSYEAQETTPTEERGIADVPSNDSAYLTSLFLPIDDAALTHRALQEIAAQLRRDLAPHKRETIVQLHHQRNTRASEQALEAAYHGNWRHAANLYRQMALTADAHLLTHRAERAAAHYNLGVALGALGNFDEAWDEVAKAERIYGRALYRETLDRLAHEREEAEDIAAMQLVESFWENPR